MTTAPSVARSAAGPALAALALVSVGAAALVCSVAWPLATYSLTLAAFGLPHVLSELRYVDRRFGRALGARRVLLMATLLAAIVAARAAGVFGWAPAAIEEPLELGLVALLALTAAGGGALTKAVALGVGLAVGLAALIDPFEAMVVFAVAHNATPLGFLWQLAPKPARTRTMSLAGLAFLGLPLLVATGAPRLALAALAGGAPDPLGAGPLVAELRVYVPSSLLASPHAIDLFSAAVAAQIAHYAAVIVVLPALLARWSPDARGLVPWPKAPLFYAALAALGALAFTRFAVDFAGARAIYSLAAAFHAWIEIPILVIALTTPQKPSSSPKPNEAPLAISETASA